MYFCLHLNIVLNTVYMTEQKYLHGNVYNYIPS